MHLRGTFISYSIILTTELDYILRCHVVIPTVFRVCRLYFGNPIFFPGLIGLDKSLQMHRWDACAFKLKCINFFEKSRRSVSRRNYVMVVKIGKSVYYLITKINYFQYERIFSPLIFDLFLLFESEINHNICVFNYGPKPFDELHNILKICTRKSFSGQYTSILSLIFVELEFMSPCP